MLLSRRTLKEFVTLAKQVLGHAPRGLAPRVCCTELGHEFKLTVSRNGHWLEYTQSGECDFSRCSLPWDGVVECADSQAKELTLTMDRTSTRFEWSENGQDVGRDYADGPSDEHEPFPAVTKMKAMDSRLFPALREALLTTDDESTRYALACLCLRGQKKDLVATDSRQLLIQTGFDWPWDDDVLIPASRCFRSAALRQAAASGPTEIGRTEKHVVLRIGCWRIALPIETEARYPDVELILPPVEDYHTTLTIDKSDRQFLADRLPQLANPDNRLVTVDLNGSVAIRSASPESSPAQELILSNAQRTGARITMDSDYRFLLRAGDLGLARIELRDRDSPFLARDERQTYVWMGFSGEPKPRPDKLQQVVSPSTDTETYLNTARSNRERNPMSNDTNNGTSAGSSSKSTSDATDTDSVDQLIEQVTTLKGKLKDLQSEMQELINSLRTQKKQAKLVRSTIESHQKLNSLQA